MEEWCGPMNAFVRCFSDQPSHPTPLDPNHQLRIWLAAEHGLHSATVELRPGGG